MNSLEPVQTYAYDDINNPMIPNYFFSRKAWSRLTINFLKWSIPGVIAVVLLLVIVLISLMGEDGSLLGIQIKYPNGILSFMSIVMISTGILGFFMIWKFRVAQTGTLTEIIAFGLVCIGIGITMLNRELKRLH